MKGLIWKLTLVAAAIAVAVAAEDEAHYPESPDPAKDLGTELLQDETTFEESPYYPRDSESGRPPFLPGREEPPPPFRAVEELNEDPRRSEPLFDTRQPSPTSSSPPSFGGGSRFRVSTQHLGSSGTRPHGFRDNEDDFAQPFDDGPLDQNQPWRPQFNNRLASRSSQASRGSAKFRGTQRYTGPRTPSQTDREDSQSASQLGAKYEYSYDINSDVTGDDKYHKEERDGNKVIGEYRVREADGTLRVVKYTADGESGFRATVNYEPGLSNEEKTKAETHRLQPGNRGRERVKVFREDAPRQKEFDEDLRSGQEDRFSSHTRLPAAGNFHPGSQGPEFNSRSSRPQSQYKEDSRHTGSSQFHRGPPRDSSFSPRDDPHFQGPQREGSQNSPFSPRKSQRTDNAFERQDTGNENKRPLTKLRGAPSPGRDEKHQQDFMGDKQEFRSRSQSHTDPKSGFLAQHGPDPLHGTRGSADPKSGFRAQHGVDDLHSSRGSADPKSEFRAQHGPDHLHGTRGSSDPKSGFRAQHGAADLHSLKGSADLKSDFRAKHGPDHLHGTRGSSDPKSGFRAQHGAADLHSLKGSADLKSDFRAQHGPDHLLGTRGSSDPKSGFRAQHGAADLHSLKGSADLKSDFRAQHGPDHLHGSRGSPDPKSGFRAQHGSDDLHGLKGSADTKTGFRSQHGVDDLHDSRGSTDLKSGFRAQHGSHHLHGSRGSPDPKSGFRSQPGPDHLHGSRASTDPKSEFRSQHGSGHLHGSRGQADPKSGFLTQRGSDHLHGSKGSAELKSGFQAQHGPDHLHGSRGSADSKSGFLAAQHGPDRLHGSKESVAPLRETQNHEEGITRSSQGFRSKTLQPLDEKSQPRSSGGPQDSRISNSQSASGENPSYHQGRSQDFRNQNIRPVSEESVSRLRGGSQAFGNENVESQDGSTAFRHEESQGFRAQTVRPRTDSDFSLQAGGQGFRPLTPQPISDQSPRLHEGSTGSRSSSNPTGSQGPGGQQGPQGDRSRFQGQHRFDAPPRSRQNTQTSSERIQEFQSSNLRDDLPAGGSAAWVGPADHSGRTGGRPSASSRQGVDTNVEGSLIRTDDRFSSQQFRGTERSHNLKQSHHNHEEHHIDAARISHRAQYEDSADLPSRGQFPSQGAESLHNPGRFPSTNIPSDDSQFSKNFQGSQSFRVGPPHPSFVGEERPSRTSVVLEGSQHRFRQDSGQRDQAIAVDPSDAPRTAFQGTGGRESLGLGAVSNFPESLHRDYRQSNTEGEFLDQ